MNANDTESLRTCCQRYQSGEWRSTIFRDLVVGSIRRFGADAVVLDIGCGGGFDGDAALQESIAQEAGRYIGIEPDPHIAAAPHFGELHNCAFAQAPLRSGSIHVAFAVFVLEHVADPGAFWQKVHDVLVPGGVFWGFTVDTRHFFSAGSRLIERLGIKDWYLTRLRGRRGTQRYENYPCYYRANTPRQIARYTRRFRRCDAVSIHRVGQLDYYFPRFLRPIARLLDRLVLASHWCGSVLVVRLEK